MKNVCMDHDNEAVTILIHSHFFFIIYIEIYKYICIYSLDKKRFQKLKIQFLIILTRSCNRRFFFFQDLEDISGKLHTITKV